VSIRISPQTEARLIDEAQRQGISVDALLERFINERVGTDHAADSGSVRLPLWHLGGVGPLHRRNIHEDVR
jgi:hypothetical protein